MAPKPKRIAVVGAGPVGSLLSLYLVRRGYSVSVFERRADPRKDKDAEGRSINLALSNRGLRALEEVGLANEVAATAIPMHGRTMHDLQGRLTFQPYGKRGQFINSISRSDLNRLLIKAAADAHVDFHFGHVCTETDLVKSEITVQAAGHSPATLAFDAIVGADGAFSAVREAFRRRDRFDFSQHYIGHGYKEFHIPAATPGAFVLEKNSLHIWPRKSFMMIALPNPDGSFTATLFFPWEGPTSFQAINSSEAIGHFFTTTFPDVVAHMPRYREDYLHKAASSLVSISCWPWVTNKTALIGDAAHAIVPFYGQGMNAGFEDCRILHQLLADHHDDWEAAWQDFQQQRKPDVDAIAMLALDNFMEMRNLVADDDFLLQKKIEAALHERYPEKWIPLYSMVTFHDDVGYAEAYALGQRQKAIMSRVMQMPGIRDRWQTLDFGGIVAQL
jgi:kynurenine 3-monooxygenase